MDPVILIFLLGIGISLLTVLGDFFIKQASLQSGFSGWNLLLAGAVVYGMTAFGWFFVMRGVKLSTLGVLYGVSTVIFLTLVSVFYFKESISSMEILAIAMAVASLVILSRFS